eukprot:scaffold7841_cov128-Isochrysis_galbana.AAC.8
MICGRRRGGGAQPQCDGEHGARAYALLLLGLPPVCRIEGRGGRGGGRAGIQYERDRGILQGPRGGNSSPSCGRLTIDHRRIPGACMRHSAAWRCQSQ